jgi:N-methylhydantoinase A
LKQPLPAGTQSEVIFGGVPYGTTSYEQGTLHPGMSGTGPAIIAGGQSTTVIPPGWTFTVDAIDTLVLTFTSAAEQAEGA